MPVATPPASIAPMTANMYSGELKPMIVTASKALIPSVTSARAKLCEFS